MPVAGMVVAEVDGAAAGAAADGDADGLSRTPA
jgi:hypothetical protein